jgi:anti-sigma B factor antagonist
MSQSPSGWVSAGISRRLQVNQLLANGGLPFLSSIVLQYSALLGSWKDATNSMIQWREIVTDGVIVLELHGEIDLQNSPEMRQLMQERAAQRIPALLLDFTGVKYIDSSGLATLIEYYQSSRAFDGRIVVAGLSHRVRSIFELVRFNEVFSICATVPEAMQALQQGLPR